MINKATKLVNNEKGQGLAEYALIIALVAIAIVGALQAFTGGLSGVFSQIVANF